MEDAAPRQVEVDELGRRFAELLGRIELGERIVVMRSGRSIAQLIPIGQRDHVEAAIDRLCCLRKGAMLGGSLRQAIEKGRR